MAEIRFGPQDRLVHQCNNCKGVFLKPINVSRLKDTYRADVIDSGDVIVGRKYNAVEDIDCPQCGKAMDKVSDDQQVHIWFESCPDGHGVFMDAGELSDLSDDSLMDIIRGWIVGKRH